jgi:hypothetical protein
MTELPIFHWKSKVNNEILCLKQYLIYCQLKVIFYESIFYTLGFLIGKLHRMLILNTSYDLFVQTT